jgi:hypothetical protein
MASDLTIFNQALSRIGIDQFVGDPNETSKGGSMYRLWYQTCVEACLRDFPWNFATRLIALAPLTITVPPGWLYAYGYPIDCLMARTVCNAAGARSTFNGPDLCVGQAVPWAEVDQGIPGYPIVARPTVPFAVMSVATSPTAVSRVIVTDMPSAYLVYTANRDDPNLFDAGFTDALAWKLASEIAGPFLGAPAGQQVAQMSGKYYANAVQNARAQTLNESGADIRPDSPAVSCRL